MGQKVNQGRMVHQELLDQLEKKATKVLKESKVKEKNKTSWLFFTEGELFSVYTEKGDLFELMRTLNISGCAVQRRLSQGQNILFEVDNQELLEYTIIPMS